MLMICWDLSVLGNLTDSKSVILVISYLAFVFFTLAIVIIMCNPWNLCGLQSASSAPFCIFYLQFYLGQDDDWNSQHRFTKGKQPDKPGSLVGWKN